MTSVAPQAAPQGAYPQAKMPALVKRLAKAKTALVLEHPFIGAIALGMPFTFDESIPTAATNGKRVIFNPHFCDGLTDEEMQFLVAHECMHPMLEHNFRRMERNPQKWNQAGDYVINQLLSDEKIGKLIEGGLLNKGLYDAGKGTSDGIYALLPEPPPNQQGGGSGDGNPLDGDLQDGEGDASEQSQQAAEWKVKVAQAAQAAKMMGKLSANMERFVSELLNPKVDWRDVLRRFVEKCRTDERTWARPNRRFLSQGIYLPSVSGEAMGELVFAVDCSGSIGEAEINQFAAEVRCVSEDHKPNVIHVVYFDSQVCHYDKFDRDEEVVIAPHGGGGTAFSPVFDYLEEHSIDPVACIFLTDLYCGDFGDPQAFPVLWVSNGADKAPFGEVVMM